MTTLYQVALVDSIADYFYKVRGSYGNKAPESIKLQREELSTFLAWCNEGSPNEDIDTEALRVLGMRVIEVTVAPLEPLLRFN